MNAFDFDKWLAEALNEDIGPGDFTTLATIPNNAIGTANCLGDIGIQTRGMTANCSYTLIFELRKHNEYYSRGQFADPAAFNYKPYGVTP